MDAETRFNILIESWEDLNKPNAWAQYLYDRGQLPGGLKPTGGELDSSPRPTPEHMGVRALEYLRGNVMGRAPEGKWLDKANIGLSEYQYNLPTAGLVEPGNIDIKNRPILRNPDGSISTEVSMSIGTDQGEILIPRVINGKLVSPGEAIDHFKKTGEHLGIFKNIDSANTYAEALHNRKLMRRGGKQEERLYAEPNYNWEIGEVDPVFHGGGKFMRFSDEFMKSGEGVHAFGWGHYVSESGGVARTYKNQYQRIHGGRATVTGFDRAKFKTAIKENVEDILGKENTDKVLDSHLFDAAVEKIKKDIAFAKDKIRDPYRAKELVESSIKRNVGYMMQDVTYPRGIGGLGITLKEPARRAELEVTKASEIGQKVSNRLIFGSKKDDVSGFYKAKLFPGKKEGVDYHLLDWDKPVDEKIFSKIVDQGVSEGVLPPGDFSSGEQLYKALVKETGSKEAASKFLDRAGIEGIRYPVGAAGGKSHATKKNYVIFNPKNIQVEEGPGFRRVGKAKHPTKDKIIPWR